VNSNSPSQSSFSTSLKRLLLVREDEWAMVSRMFAFEFFQGASIEENESNWLKMLK
jgi:hypothetical protein